MTEMTQDQIAATRNAADLFDKPSTARQVGQAPTKTSRLYLESSAVIDGHSIDALRPWFERFVALTLLFVSWLSTIATFHGGWALPW
ncbi:MAG: hypothetical protein IT564_11390, partial [Rhodospirillales bacterium]|nr:hypothetical protein [Rhodospirillales bacterium]